jgi:hypothetical protein
MALELAGLITDPSIRDQQLSAVVTSLMDRDPKAAHSLINQSQLSDETKKHLLARFATTSE